MGLSDAASQEARSTDDALRRGTLVTFSPQETPTRGFSLHLDRPVNQSLLVGEVMPLREKVGGFTPGRKALIT